MGDYINVIIGRDNDEILKRIYNVNNGCDTVLILFGIDNLRVSSACKSVKKTYICNDEYAAMMILSAEFGGFDGIFAELTNETLKDIYTKNKKYYSEKYVFNFVSAPGVLTVPEHRVAARRRIRKIFEKTKLGKLYNIIRKICHIDIEQKILVADGMDIPKNTSAFGFVQITEENLESLYKDKSVIAEARELKRASQTEKHVRACHDGRRKGNRQRLYKRMRLR